jgi:ABC-type transport system involved in cytochrome bd biosynthesis fused ATPase/permease subunit
MPSYRYHLGAYGRLVCYLGAIKTEVAIKVVISLGVNATYILQAVLMARAVSLVFSRSPLSALIPYILGALAAVAVRGILARIFEIYGKVMAATVKTKIRFLVFDKILLTMFHTSSVSLLPALPLAPTFFTLTGSLAW